MGICFHVFTSLICSYSWICIIRIWRIRAYGYVFVRVCPWINVCSFYIFYIFMMFYIFTPHILYLRIYSVRIECTCGYNSVNTCKHTCFTVYIFTIFSFTRKNTPSQASYKNKLNRTRLCTLTVTNLWIRVTVRVLRCIFPPS